MTTTGPRRVSFGGKVLAHIETCRPDSSLYVGIVGVAGALLASADPTGWQLAGAWLAPTLGWLASLYGGDYYDRDLDAIGKRHRSIPSGRMSAGAAFAGMVVTIVLGTAVALALDPLNIVLVALAGGLGFSYSKWLKARGILGNIARGGPTAFSLLLGATSVRGTIPLDLVPIALMFWVHDSSSNLVGALCDLESDRRGGCATFPVTHGDRATIRLVAILDVGWLALAVGVPLGWQLSGTRTVNWPILGTGLAVAALLAAWSVRILLRAPRPTPRLAGLRSHEVIVIERLLLPCVLIAATASPGAALLFLIPSALITRSAQLLMRGRYEPGRAAHRPGRLKGATS
ncbi:UbiA family prenyltransferase [Amycolatopsis sp. A133]|jgi:4-hydroxybenzoate polyprenyltransferase/geranylgeranylglycerol-phosphate geranylgeranyltransferase|uniref:UbiA family prenyltransferase n=1 Tax=Amycolatopsis sp. A133 TaxID=3064472 RepID=UPI0027EF8264|nr:UbiA family prenyltransferase [Amycolatopsis sp. A133]MDQ7807630.1 UbiA family prenyltransferase [Amycolatopsis sp. A133]